MNEKKFNMNINIQDLKSVVCDCGSVLYNQVFIVKRVPGLMAGTPKDTIAPVPVFSCVQCGEILIEFLPPNILDNKEEPEPDTPPIITGT